MSDERLSITEQELQPITEQELQLRGAVRERWGNVIVRDFVRRPDGTLISVVLQDPHVPRSDNRSAITVHWYPGQDYLIGSKKDVALFEWFEAEQARRNS